MSTANCLQRHDTSVSLAWHTDILTSPKSHHQIQQPGLGHAALHRMPSVVSAEGQCRIPIV
ncbi:uncharacterized protein FOMMEDRAFT_161867 [Fomitiporia mediterranea MF3/22]|uniref:uncharacterized protein n=1 Tax=Fomitiporia mediterranea (strain MF3/22) TaxID=694068 RepID=UPI0004408AF6|nr:uncharacterized protein FOMMEDRAFT_161867 [Fomitiporia mediterranea MF3/22]EJC98490.1 hypothetical protein FOMMEDRAFT_161867 [Fomitiporia mediterranea MF3/22]